MNLAHLANTLLKDEESARDNNVIACNLLNISQLKKFTDRLSNKPFLIWLLTTPPHLKYVATLPCNLSLMACFADINISQVCVATYARCGWIFYIHLTTNFSRNLPVKIFNWSRLHRIVAMSICPRFFGPPCTLPATLKSVLTHS